MSLTKELFEFIGQIKQDPSLINELDESLIELFKSHKIIVEEHEDDDFLLKRQFSEDRISYAQSTLGLIIVPTLSCNFDCPYCFEEGKKGGIMSDSTIDELMTFIKKHELAKDLVITWYGGEPLLAFDAIKKILNKIKSEIRIPIRWQSMVTNGYYFDSEVIDYFKENPLHSIQITLDGNRERHDRIRKQKNTGEGSYDRLIGNIDQILREMPDTKVSVRVNIEKVNKDDFLVIQKELTDKWKGKNISFYPGFLRIENETKTALSCDAISQWESKEFYYELNKNEKPEGIVFPQLLDNQGCCATMVNAYIIGPKGEIYKCWNDVSNENKIVGYIRDNNLSDSSLFLRYLLGSRFYYNDDCKNCFYLPICQGYCPWFRLKNQYEGGEFVLCECMQRTPGMLNRNLESWYDNQIKIKKECAAH
ncbi:MAG: SPASM domain-containing protein [Candidatus Azobacteroides sp.]|nr:SPASM domain-containing protein [Candidatus Azobacteroides sp.]